MERNTLHLLSLATILALTPFLAQADVQDGYVVKVEGKTVYLDWGKASGAQDGDRFSIYRSGAELKHPVTGEVLGHSEQVMGNGILDKIEDKFSLGQMIDSKGEIRPGDRTRLLEPTPVPIASPPSVQTTPNAPVPALTASALKERWRSDTFKDQAMGIVLADIDGDGTKEVVVAFRNRIEAFRLKDQKLESLGSFTERKWGSWLALDAADLKHDGREEIFATAYMDVVHRGHIVVLRWDNGLKRVGDLEGFARRVTHSDGSRALLWQGMSRSREVLFMMPCPIVVGPKGYKVGSPLGIKRLREDQLFGFTWGDWDGDKAEDLVVLQNDHLRAFFKDAKWSSSDLYGGTKADFEFVEDLTASVAPRLETLASASGPQLLVAPHNIAELGIRLEHLKLYKNSEISGLKWNGLEMTPVWRVALAGYLADYAIGQPAAAEPNQLVTALIGPGGKTVLVSYALP